jgi:hypothetical protein
MKARFVVPVRYVTSESETQAPQGVKKIWRREVGGDVDLTLCYERVDWCSL